MHKISRREWIAVSALLLLAFALRMNDLAGAPPGLHIDELANVEMTESVTHGRIAIFFPENIGNEALYFYVAAPFMDLIGKSIVALRLPPIFMSMVGMCVIWALTRRLFGPVAALTAAAGFAATFWTLLTGRILVRTVLEVPLAALAAYCFWRARTVSGRRTWVLFGLSGLFAGLAIDTQDRLFTESIQKCYYCFNHTVAAEPSGKMIGVTDLNHRVAMPWTFPQSGGGVRRHKFAAIRCGTISEYAIASNPSP